ncbi:hypothetical protein KIL84_005384 [Mauremys mutica]|uniref:Uncharacterized protein n=1 Tax=Mauremys mutica TaxID=74926 RepID=A0A9D3XLV3_9SAUR|nr:hypothetical protein KIL84_005384 [Mauremys mutica]
MPEQHKGQENGRSIEMATGEELPRALKNVPSTFFIASNGCTKSADAKKTALHWAAKHGNLEMAEMVAKAGVDVNAKSVYTIFHGAAVHNQELLICSLINAYIARVKEAVSHSVLGDSNPEHSLHLHHPHQSPEYEDGLQEKGARRL